MPLHTVQQITTLQISSADILYLLLLLSFITHTAHKSCTQTMAVRHKWASGSSYAPLSEQVSKTVPTARCRTPQATVQVSFHNTYTFVLNTEQKPRTHGRVRRGGVATKLKLNNNAPTSFSFPVTRDLIAIIISWKASDRCMIKQTLQAEIIGFGLNSATVLRVSTVFSACLPTLPSFSPGVANSAFISIACMLLICSYCLLFLPHLGPL